jgi:hypothetical protein
MNTCIRHREVSVKVRWLLLTLMLLPISIWVGLQAQSEIMELVLEQGLADYDGTRDTSLFEEGELSNGGGQHLFGGLTNRNDLRRALIAFDLSIIPQGATIVEASLQFTVSKVQFQRVNSNFDLHRLTSNWGEGETDSDGEEGRGADAADGDATWTANFLNESMWTNPGGDFEAMASASARSLGDGSVTMFEGEGLIADIQAWLDGTVENFGWIVVGDGQARRFYSSESEAEVGQKPRLVIRYQATD